MTNRTVALTGSTGFLGRYIVNALLADGWHIRGLVRDAGSADPRITPVVGELADVNALERLVDGAGALVHAAGCTNASSRADFFRTNRDGSILLAHTVMRLNPDMRLVVVSSLAAREPDLSDYAASKLAEEEAFQGAGLRGVVVLRPAAIYGPGDVDTGVLIGAADGPLLPIPCVPKSRITMIHARDAAEAIAAFCNNDAAGIYELCDARPAGLPWIALAANFAAAARRRTRIIALPRDVFLFAAVVQAGLFRRRPSILTAGKVRELFHEDWSCSEASLPPAEIWRPRISLARGLVETISWLRSIRN